MMMCSPPNSLTAVFTKRSPKSASVTLPAHTVALPPVAVMSAAVCSATSLSRSLTTTEAPEAASLRAISRPMPRPEPETSATRSASGSADMVLLGELGLWERDGGGAGEGDRAVGEGDGELEADPALPVHLVDGHHPAGAGRPRVHRRDRGEAHREGPDPGLRHPVGEQPAQVGHGQHAVREHV